MQRQDHLPANVFSLDAKRQEKYGGSGERKARGMKLRTAIGLSAVALTFPLITFLKSNEQKARIELGNKILGERADAQAEMTTEERARYAYEQALEDKQMQVAYDQADRSTQPASGESTALNGTETGVEAVSSEIEIGQPLTIKPGEQVGRAAGQAQNPDR